jgi:ribosomal protein S12 methylthiotransferase
MAKVGFVSLGCPKNLVDSEVMLGMLQQNGHQITADQEEADIIVVNTCGFIENAKQESIDTILEMAERKSSGNCRRLIVAGCLVERYRKQIMEQIPEVDAVVGTNEIPSILSACGDTSSLAEPVYEDRELYLYDHRDPRVQTTPRHSAYIKIAEGCDHPCSFCVIPQMRGPFRSRPLDSVVKEAGKMASTGVKEINLIGQDTTMYGWDHGDPQGLASLLHRLSDVDGIEWIRFLYAYPNNIYYELLDAMAQTPKACKYIDVPLQHASSSVLKSMRRGGNRHSLTNLIKRIRSRVPDVVIRTTMIVGLPGETDEDFEELLDFVEVARFDRLGAFTFSDEEDAGSAGLDDKVDKETMQSRLDQLMKLQSEISLEQNSRLLNRVEPVMLEGPSKESDLLWEGRLSTQAPDIDGVVYLTDGVTDQMVPGQIVPVQIDEIYEYDLVGKVVV